MGDNKWGEWFYYDEASPSCLRWKVNRYRARAGSVAGSKIERKPGKFTYCLMFLYKHRQVHRIIWELHNGPIPEDKEIDHKNGNSDDNRLDNLRVVPRILNARNRRMMKSNTSGSTGVQKVICRGVVQWRASWRTEDGRTTRTKTLSVSVHGKEAKTLAIEARKEAMKKLSGYTSRHGVPA